MNSERHVKAQTKPVNKHKKRRCTCCKDSPEASAGRIALESEKKIVERMQREVWSC